MKHPVHLYLLGYVFNCICAVRTLASCPHPNVPENGYYTPKQSRFEPGDEVIYRCKKGFSLTGKERRTCKSDGVWSEHSPFCDHAVQLENPSVENERVILPLVARVIDNNTNTCFEWVNPKGRHMYVHLNKKIVIRTIKIYLSRGSVAIQILTGLNNRMTFCADYSTLLETDRWILIRCKNNVLADTVKILATENSTLTVCEIEVFGKAEDGCEHPPNRKIPNGYFEVSRSKAVLICEDGFRTENNNRLACEGNNTWIGGRLKCDEVLCNPIVSREQPGVEWTFIDMSRKLSVGTRSQMTCRAGYKKTGGSDTVFCQKTGTWTEANATCVDLGDSKQKIKGIVLGVVAIVVVFVIIALLAAIIYFIKKQKDKEVVVVFQPQSDESVISGPEAEYAEPRYESLKSKPPEPPSTPRPFHKLSTMSRGGILNSPSSADEKCGTMKSSTIYGS